MVDRVNETFAGWDGTFLDVSSKMAEPFCFAYHQLRYRLVAPLDPQKFENCNTHIKEVAVRALIALSIVFAVFLCAIVPIPMLCAVTVLALGSRLFRVLGFALQKEGYTPVRSQTAEKQLTQQNSTIKVATWNICGAGGGMSLDHGGVIDWRSRVKGIVDTIRKEDPDVLLLQEIYDEELGRALVKKLADKYVYFYTNLGPNNMGSVGGCMVASKYATHKFSHISFENNKWTLNRGFATLEIKADAKADAPCARIICTHLIHGDDEISKKNRIEQIQQIAAKIFGWNAQHDVPTILAGDLNIEQKDIKAIELDVEKDGVLSKEPFCDYFDHVNECKTPTCTSKLATQWTLKPGEEETIDYILSFRKDKETEPVVYDEFHYIKAHDGSGNTKTALSDHHGLVVNFKAKISSPAA